MRKKLGIGILGLDHWYWALGSAYHVAINPNSRLVALSDPKSKLVEKIAGLYGARTWYIDYHELLENPEVDSVVITTTTDLHAKTAVDAAKAGKNILVGKPISRTLKEADRIIKAAHKAGVKLMAMGAGPIEGDRVKILIEKGIIGKPYAAHSSHYALLPKSEPDACEPGWFADPNKAAGGAFIDHAIYSASNLRGYFDSEVRRVYAEMGKFVHKNLAVEDYGIAMLRFVSGSVATIEATFTARKETHSRTMIIGTEGEIEARGDTLSICGTRDPYKNPTIVKISPASYPQFTSHSYRPVPIPPFAMYYKPTVDRFIESVTKNVKPTPTGEDGRAALEICLAAYESLRTKKPVSLPLKSEVNVPSILANLHYPTLLDTHFKS